MKTLFLLRHAQTVPSSGAGDAERKLTPQGQKDAHKLGAMMREKNYQPDFALCSPVVRTRQTLDGVMETLGDLAVQYVETIYTGDCHDLLTLIQKTDEKYNALLVVAHNPSIHALAAMLADDDSSLASGYAPGTLCVLDCPCENWADIQPGENSLRDLLEAPDYSGL